MRSAGIVASDGVRQRKGRGVQLDAFIARFPRPAPAALALSLAGVAAGNGYLFWRVWQGDLRLTAIVLLVLVEGVLLSILAAAQRSFVPAGQRMKSGYEHVGLPAQALGWVAFVVAIGGAYVLWAYLLDELDAARELLTSLSPWRDSGMLIALAITALFAIGALVADHAHFRRAGPPFVSSVEMESTARRVTLAYGAIVIAIPLMVTMAFATWAIPRLIGKRDTNRWNFIGGVSVIAVFFGTFAVLARLADSGPLGWAAVYLWGKALVEGLFVALPVLARRAAPARA